MNTFLNYLVESNLSLLIVFALYWALLRKETNFPIVRLVLMAGVTLSFLVPLVHLDVLRTSAVPPLDTMIPVYWLPEISAGGESISSETVGYASIIWQSLLVIYCAGVLLALIRFTRELRQIAGIFRNGNISRENGLTVVETETPFTFSFFKIIFIERNAKLSALERNQIIRHEAVHVRQWHSLDIILLNVLSIVFWFNPIIHTYKKVFVQLHEFEADARAVENDEVNRYCDLLARVALQSAGFHIASHFNNSLTIKRIEMMKTLKSKIKWWRMAAWAFILAGLFVFVACQDQVGSEQPFTGGNVPEEAQARFETFRENYPGPTFLVEYDEDAENVLAGLEAKYGQASHIELFTLTVAGKPVNYSMLQFESPVVSKEDIVFTVVENQPEFNGGHEKLVDYLSDNLVYPEDARRQGIEGTVYVRFTIQKDGSVADAELLKGIDRKCDAEALRVVKSSPPWEPGTQNGKIVKVQMVLPIKFKLE